MLSIFTPRWKKEARHLHKGGKKFLHYKRDLLPQDRIDEIESRRADLLDAIKAGDRSQVDEASKQLKATCEGSLARHEPQGWFEENVEVIFVAIVIALGLRAYFLQPFRIPTGSMQPSLNGIVGTQLPRDEWPSFPVRIAQSVLRGRSYAEVVNSRERTVATRPNGAPDIRDTQFLHFFSRSVLMFTDGSSIRLPAPASQTLKLGLNQVLSAARMDNWRIPAGTVLCEGTVDAGDLVLVDKVSYQFRRPKRGESFVFDTRGIRGIHNRQFDGQEAGSHYIKRLCGVPGDTLSIDSPNLLIDGRIAQESTIQRVIRAEGPYSINHGYQLADGAHDNGVRYLDAPGKELKLADDVPVWGMREYAALGDNTGNSLDSRYWGRVKEFNLVGPALFSLWPVTTGHWGVIP